MNVEMSGLIRDNQQQRVARLSLFLNINRTLTRDETPTAQYSVRVALKRQLVPRERASAGDVGDIDPSEPSPHRVPKFQDSERFWQS